MRILAPLAVPLFLATVALAQEPAFEAASVRTASPEVMGFQIIPKPGRLTITNLDLRGIIRYAWNLGDYQVSPTPHWVESERYDIVATAGTPAGDDELRLMLRTLVAERFHLAVHWEKHPGATYALVIARGGPRIARAIASNRVVSTAGGDGLRGMGGHLTAGGVSMAKWALFLTKLCGRPVTDETGLEGDYDFTLEWIPDQGTATSSEDDRATLFTALQEQLGLKLEARKGDIETLVIDHVEKASAN